ncbi:TPA: hypothetical protein ACHV9Z_005252 [Klebsiella pneumoniae]|nr:hypothetical protein [Klebsiella pneumoniae]HCP6331899.1 hypothetical protein [Escherichia coli]
MSGKTVEVTCKCCPDKFMARVSDRKRGWAQFCSKSCAAFWKQYGKRRCHQTEEMRESARIKNNLQRIQGSLRESDYEDDELEFGEFEDHNKE